MAAASPTRRWIQPETGDTLASIAARELPELPEAEALRALQSWNLHLVLRPGMPVSEAGAFIEAAELAAGHDGRAELVLRLRYPNGASCELRLDEEAVAFALEAAGVTRLDDLTGRPWDILARAL
jgi:hypothetical protein